MHAWNIALLQEGLLSALGHIVASRVFFLQPYVFEKIVWGGAQYQGTPSNYNLRNAQVNRNLSKSQISPSSAVCDLRVLLVSGQSTALRLRCVCIGLSQKGELRGIAADWVCDRVYHCAPNPYSPSVHHHVDKSCLEVTFFKRTLLDGLFLLLISDLRLI